MTSPEEFRVHQHDRTPVLKDALVRTGRSARQYADQGYKNGEDVMHTVANQLLDELEARGELGEETA